MYAHHEFPIAAITVISLPWLCVTAVISRPWYHQNMYNFNFQMVKFVQICSASGLQLIQARKWCNYLL